MTEIEIYIAVVASAVVLVLSLFSLYLRSPIFLWAIYAAACIGIAASVAWVISAETVYWYKIALYIGGYIYFLRLIAKKYARKERFFSSWSRRDANY